MSASTWFPTGRAVGSAPVLALALFLAFGAAGVTSAAAPEIYGLEPNEAPPGAEVRLDGRGLRTTGLVAFSVGQIVRPAKFRVVSDRELRVTVPEFYRPDTPAIVAVRTMDGVTVAMPPGALTIDGSHRRAPANATFYHVLRGGNVANAGGVALIEEGGTVTGSQGVGLHLVKRGGLLAGLDVPGALVFHEPGAIFGSKFQSPRNSEGRALLVTVPEVTASPGVEPFLFRAARQPPDPARRPPQIGSIDPPQGIPGAVITLHGRGFLGTTALYFARARQGGIRKAGFRVVSDREIRAEVPEGSAAPREPQFVIVVNPKGATITIPADPIGRPYREVQSLFEYLGRGRISTHDGGVVLVGDGGIATHPASLFFLKNGARLAAPSAGAIFYEPEASLPETLLGQVGGQNAHLVEAIEPSPLPVMFLCVPP